MNDATAPSRLRQDGRGTAGEVDCRIQKVELVKGDVAHGVPEYLGRASRHDWSQAGIFAGLFLYCPA